jgi:ribosomal-protein-alanine N-acetyltransferase
VIILESNRLYVRRYTSGDVDTFYDLNGDPELMQFIRPPMNFEQSKQFLDENIQYYEMHPTIGRWALVNKSDDQIVGSFSLLPLQQTTDLHIGYVLFKPYWGMGYAAEIVQAGIAYAFHQLGLETLTAITYAENFSSQKVLLKNGFAFERAFYEKGKENRLYRINRIGY